MRGPFWRPRNRRPGFDILRIVALRNHREVTGTTSELEIYRGQTLSGGQRDRIYVVSHAELARSAEDWKAICDLISSHYADAHTLFILTSWASPNAAQRRAALAMLPKKLKVPAVSIMSAAILVRGVVTALNWFLSDAVRAFPPANRRGLSTHLKTSEDDAEQLIAFAKKLAPV